MLVTTSAIAQKRPSQEKLSAPLPTDPVTKSEALTVVKEEFEKVKLENNLEIRERVQNEVDRSFGWTMGLIQILLAVLAALPIFASIFLLLLRGSIKNQIVEEFKKEIKEKLEKEVKHALKEIDERSKLQIDNLLKVSNKRVEDLLTEVAKKKDDIIERIDRLVPETSKKDDFQKSVDSDILAQVQELTARLDMLQDSYPNLVLTATDYVKKGKALLYKSSYEEALTDFEKAIKLKPDDPEAWLNKGFTLGKLKRNNEEITAYEEALNAYEKAIEPKSDDPKTWFNKGFMLLELKRHEEALNAFKKTIELNPYDPDAWFNKGIVLSNLKRYEEALVAYEKAIELNPHDPKTWFNKGITLGNLKRNNEELAAYGKAIELNPDGPDAWFNKACCFSLNGDTSLAIQNLKQSIDIDSTFRDKAKKDPDFDNIRNNTGFKEIIEKN